FGTTYWTLMGGVYGIVPWFYVLGGILVLAGSVLILIAAFKEKKRFVIVLGASMMLAGVIIYYIAIGTFPLVTAVFWVLDLLEKIFKGFDFGSVYSGSHTFRNVINRRIGNLTWGITNYFYITVVTSVVAMIGAILDFYLTGKK
ncbi:MAG: hypothetical protein ACFFBD_11585, partial [Candidatus Hodarchaeota archaeon]